MKQLKILKKIASEDKKAIETVEAKRQRLIESWAATGYLNGLKAPTFEKKIQLESLFGSKNIQLLGEDLIVPLAIQVAKKWIEDEKELLKNGESKVVVEARRSIEENKVNIVWEVWKASGRITD